MIVTKLQNINELPAEKTFRQYALVNLEEAVTMYRNRYGKDPETVYTYREIIYCETPESGK